MRPVAEPGAQFVELEVREVELLEEAVVQGRAVCASPRQPSRDGGVAMPEHPHGGGDREPFGQRRQHFGNPLGCGFEPVERRIAARAEGRPTGLAAQGLDSFALPMRAVTDQGMDAAHR